MALFEIFKRFRKAEAKSKEEEVYKAFTISQHIKGSYEDFYQKLLNSSLIMLIIGKRGSGKSALGMKFLEMFGKETKKKTFIIGYQDAKLPRWIKKTDTMSGIPNNSVVLVDEGAVAFSSRDSMKDANKMLGKLMAIARHKNLTLALVTQNSAMIDLNVLRLADTIFLKEPSLLQSKFERKALKDMYEKVAPSFKDQKNKKDKFYVWDDDFEGMLSFKLPEFWNEKISKSL